jgi:hypothetical protein
MKINVLKDQIIAISNKNLAELKSLLGLKNFALRIKNPNVLTAQLTQN